MHDTIELYDDDERANLLATQWNPSEWIGNQRIYHDVPAVVEAARARILTIPPSFTPNLPPPELPISDLIPFHLPPIMDPATTPMDDDSERFSDMEATRDIEEMLPLLIVPTRREVAKFFEGVGQAWFDGKKSLCTWVNPEIVFPFWVLTYWREVLDASDAKDRWIAAAQWLKARGRTEEELVQKRTIQDLWNILGWRGSMRGFAGVSVSDLADLFSPAYLHGNLVDALLNLLSIRLKGLGDRRADCAIIVDTSFAGFVDLMRPHEDGIIPISSNAGAQKYLSKYATWFRGGERTELHFVLYRHPHHWTACSIDFAGERIRYGDSLKWKRPNVFFGALETWTTNNFPDKEFVVTDDLPCAIQTDGYNCPIREVAQSRMRLFCRMRLLRNLSIISVNTIAHNVFGDPLWTKRTADTMRMKAFCDIVTHSLTATVQPIPATPIADACDSSANMLAVYPDVNDTFVAGIMSDGVESGSCEIIAPGLSAIQHADAPVRGQKRATDGDGEERKKKVAKTSADSDSSGRADNAVATHPFFAKGFKSSAPAAKGQKPAALESSSSVGISKSAAAARKQREDIRNGNFRPSARKTANFREKCRKVDADAEFEETSKKVQCSNCKRWLEMQEAYSATRFEKHVERNKCEPPPPEPLSDPTKRTLDDFRMVATRPKPKNPPPPPTVTRPCPGLTTAFDEKVGNYLDRATSSGGGAHPVNHYSREMFKKDFADLTDKQKDTVQTARIHDYCWVNNTSPGVMACFAAGSNACLKTVEIDTNSSVVPPCGNCKLLATLKLFKTAISRKAADPSNLKYVPHANRNPHSGMLFAKFKGLEAFLTEDSKDSVERRFALDVVNGKFKDDKVFTGLLHAKVMAKDREIRGKGMQNFKYDTDMDSVFGLVHTISLRAYRELRKHLPIRSERSIKHIVSTTPRFPIGIADETFIYAKQYLNDYKFPLGAPLSLAVDDAKLFPALRPLYDGVKNLWYIVGTTGEHVAVPNAKGLHETLDKLESTAELATKLRLWILQIPLPGVPPLVVAILPIGSKVKGPELAQWQIRLMEGLVSRGFRITSGGGDGASVERDCQRRTAAVSKLIEVQIKHPDVDYPDIIVPLWDLNGNIWAIIQDAKHGRKTFRNNVFSGARTLTLGNFVVFFELIHTLGMQPTTPLYRRDFIKSDRMDDPAAARFFSADFLAQAAEDPAENLGLVVYLLVFGDFIDAWQSRTLSHQERAKILIRTHLFLHTWRAFLAKAGYPEARHFISKEAFDIAQILINGLLGLIIIHRDHLGAHPCPLLPWFNASEPNEHCFAGMRDITADFTMQQAILIIPKLRAKMQASVRVPKTQSDFKKQASGYCHTYYSSESIDYDLLSRYPTEVELSDVYATAAQENEGLWSLLGIHPTRIESTPIRGLAPAPPPDPAFEHLYLEEETPLEAVAEKTPAEELQEMIDSLKTTANLSRAADEQLDACVMASVALSMDELARVEDMPESDPERFAEIHKDIAHALATQPAAFVTLLQNMADAAAKNNPPSVIEKPLLVPLADVSPDDLSPFVAVRRQHQTEEARTGVRTYKTSGTYINPKTGVEKPLTDRQLLARQMQAIIRQDQERGSSTGLNRKIRWQEADAGKADGTVAAKSKTGNAANAELAANGRSKEVRPCSGAPVRCQSRAKTIPTQLTNRVMRQTCHAVLSNGHPRAEPIGLGSASGPEQALSCLAIHWNRLTDESVHKAIKRRRTILGKLKCVSTVAEAAVGAADARRLENRGSQKSWENRGCRRFIKNRAESKNRLRSRFIDSCRFMRIDDSRVKNRPQNRHQNRLVNRLLKRTLTPPNGCYGFAMIGSEITLVRVKTMYSKTGGKTGTHSWIATTDTIGNLSFLVAQVYEHEFRRRFRTIHRADALLGTIRFAHLPVGSFLALVPKDEAVKAHAEIGVRAYQIFDGLVAEKDQLSRAVASLNTVRRKGKTNIHVLELSEDNCVESDPKSRQGPELAEVEAGIPTRFWAGRGPKVPTNFFGP
ncbi:hypothetical protein C8R45DRAFT_1073149 [Mycena sanguinolenta]|nr:hypothetical protein C8R45DRAFT_1073149 [Mycena sanguinolenta]